FGLLLLTPPQSEETLKHLAPRSRCNGVDDHHERKKRRLRRTVQNWNLADQTNYSRDNERTKSKPDSSPREKPGEEPIESKATRPPIARFEAGDHSSDE